MPGPYREASEAAVDAYGDASEAAGQVGKEVRNLFNQAAEGAPAIYVDASATVIQAAEAAQR